MKSNLNKISPRKRILTGYCWFCKRRLSINKLERVFASNEYRYPYGRHVIACLNVSDCINHVLKSLPADL